MAAINIRLLGDGVVERLKQRAARNNRSLDEEVRNILECAAADDMAAKRTAILVASDQLLGQSGGRKQTPAEVLIRQDRDHGHCEF